MATTSPEPSIEQPSSQWEFLFRANADGFNPATQYISPRSSLGSSPRTDHQFYTDDDIRSPADIRPSPLSHISSPYTNYDISTNYDINPPAEIRHTPSSLGWSSNSDLLSLYTFIPGRGSEEPHFKLVPPWVDTYQTPHTVYLDSTNFQEGVFPCRYPSTCQRVFFRPADLDRHYENVHAPPKLRREYECDYPKCDKKNKRCFFRKDHYRDHLRDYHKEDLGHAKKLNHRGFKDSNSQKSQNRWLDERQISSTWWRCSKCLTRVRVKENMWVCPAATCKHPCEADRKAARIQSVQAPFQQDDYSNYSTYPNRSDCDWVENGEWAPCFSSQLPANNYGDLCSYGVLGIDQQDTAK